MVLEGKSYTLRSEFFYFGELQSSGRLVVICIIVELISDLVKYFWLTTALLFSQKNRNCCALFVAFLQLVYYNNAGKINKRVDGI